jgi:hypothetical protein
MMINDHPASRPGGPSPSEPETGSARKDRAQELEVPDEIQRVAGHGTVRCGDATVADVDYDLTITPPHLRGTTFEPGNEPKVSPDITGRLMGPLFGAEALADGVHTLVLEDGREFDFRVLQPDTNEIIGVSWFRSPPARTRTSQRS